MGPGTEAGTQEGSYAISAGGVSQASTPSNRIAVYEDLRFAYDVHGNITERRIGWHTVQRLHYSAEHQLQSITVTRLHDKPPLKVVGQEPQELAATTQTTHYRYDALGRRIDKTGEFGSTRFGWDGDLLTVEIRGSKQSEYLYEPDSFVPLAKLESQASVQKPQDKAINPKKIASLFKTQTTTDSEQKPAVALEEQALAAIESEVEVTAAKAKPKDFAVFYYQCDQIGAPQELTDEQGNIVWAAEYKVWGRTSTLEVSATGTDNLDPYDLNRFWPGGPRDLKARSSSTTQALNQVEQNLRFQGQYFDSESGLHYNRFRYYDPQTGRFVHQDPIGLFGGVNNYFYASNPFDWLDPFGLAARSGPGIRGKLYPSRVRKGTQKKLEEQQKDKQGNILCPKCTCALTPGNMSVQHDPALVETHNKLGYNTDQKTRNNLYNSTATSLNCLECQRAEGGTMSHTQQYRTDTGPDFKPRNSKKKGGGCD